VNFAGCADNRVTDVFLRHPSRPLRHFAFFALLFFQVRLRTVRCSMRFS
jgi:hypothetical protein